MGTPTLHQAPRAGAAPCCQGHQVGSQKKLELLSRGLLKMRRPQACRHLWQKRPFMLPYPPTLPQRCLLLHREEILQRGCLPALGFQHFQLCPFMGTEQGKMIGSMWKGEWTLILHFSSPRLDSRLGKPCAALSTLQTMDRSFSQPQMTGSSRTPTLLPVASMATKRSP